MARLELALLMRRMPLVVRAQASLGLLLALLTRPLGLHQVVHEVVRDVVIVSGRRIQQALWADEPRFARTASTWARSEVSHERH